MRLHGDLFEILDTGEQADGFSATISLFPGHIIFGGHFPGHPVTPGVVLLQIVHTLIEHYLKKSIRLVELPNCKFLRVVNPELESLMIISVTITYENQRLQVKAIGNNHSGTIFKLQAVYALGWAN
jgi:3-hydroxyacyl-[acyl-carrier-protein] dehydratase